ncbi:hypothetical protein [Formosa algae]|uniref:Uncharacterized protein n=1 Tax=Formosa algae TaxID=225843 RepID=A0A9X0YKJ0_9FLAO|nr:hypothetical protein [Formosa algae]MBP1838889.1 hypothetical protein [Formosa algae]MDQ0333666.1 hypothetical protein [Formosa algae]OEI78853.1 hypothetical protein AST99_16900 [Formosa algae]
MKLKEETKKDLFEITQFIIENTTKSLDNNRILLIKNSKVKELLISHEIDITHLEKSVNILEYRMLIGLLLLDLNSSTRAYLNSVNDYEKLYASRQIIVIIKEGYQKIYDFVFKNNEGQTVMKNRNKSFWNNEIRMIIENDIPELVAKYEEITIALNEFYDNNFDSIKEQRDLSIHYDKKASKVYDMITNIDIDGTFKKMIPFSDILFKMLNFTEKIAEFLIEILRKENNKTYESTKMNFEKIKKKISKHNLDIDIEQLTKLFNTIKLS